MSKYENTIINFNRGEVDEKFMARSDVDRLRDTCAEMVNFMPIRLGPMVYRSGTRYLGDGIAAANRHLVPFLVSNNESVMLEFYQTTANPSVDGFRVWDDGALLSRTATADTITNGDFNGNITGWTDGSDAGGTAQYDATSGDLELIGNGTTDDGIAYQTLTTTASAKRTVLIKVSGPYVECRIGSNGAESSEIFSGVLKRGQHSLTFTPTGAATTITFIHRDAFSTFVEEVSYEAAGAFALAGSFFKDTSTAGAVVKTLQYWQSADTLFLTTDGYTTESFAYPLLMVERRGTESWSLVIPELWDGPFGAINLTGTTITPSATTGDVNLTASNELFVDNSWLGRPIKLDHSGTEGVAVITSITSTTVATARVLQAFNAATATADWYPGLWGEQIAGPSTVCIYEGRLWLAGAGRVHGSVSDAYQSFDETVSGDSAAITKDLGFGPVQVPSWLSPSGELILGTKNEEIRVGSNMFRDVVTPSNARATSVGTNVGVSRIMPERAGSDLIAVQRAQRRLIRFMSMGNADGADSEDLNMLHPDIADAGIRRIAYVKTPDPRIYVVLEDGTMLVMLFDKAEKVTGWSHIELSSGTFEDIAVIPDDEEDVIYVVVARGGSEYIESFAALRDAIGGTTSLHYDSHVVYSSPGASVTGLDHLDGVLVYIWADGKERGSATVASGTINLPSSSYTDVVVGVRHVATYKSNRLGQYIPKDVITDRKRIFGLGLVMRNVVLSSLKFGPDSATLTAMPEVIQTQFAPTTEPVIQASASQGAVTYTEVVDSTQVEVGEDGYLVILDSASGVTNSIARADAGNAVLQHWTFGGTTFTQDGNDFTLTTPDESALTVLGPTTIAYADIGVKTLSTYEWDGTDWSKTGNSLSISAGGIQSYWMATMTSTRVAILYLIAGADVLRVFDWDGTDWAQVGTDKVYSSTDNPLGITGLTATQVAYIKLADLTLQTWTFNGSTWSQDGNSFSLPSTSDDAMVLTALGTTTVVYTDNFNDNITTYEWDGTDWSKVGNSKTISGLVRSRITAMSGSRIALVDDSNKDLQIYDWDGTDWTQTGSDTAMAGGSLEQAIGAMVGAGAGSGTLSIVSLADPSSFNEVGSVSAANFGNGGYLAYNSDASTVYVASGTDVLSAVDISDPTTPAVLGSASGHATLTDMTAIEFDSEYIAVASSSNTSIGLYDVSDPTAMTLVLTVSDASFTNIVDMELINGILVCASPDDTSLKLVNSFGIKSTLTDATVFAGISAISGDGSLVYTASETNNYLGIVDISDKFNPVLIGSLQDATNFANIVDIEIDGDFVYILTSDGKMTTVNVADPSTPVTVGTYTSGGDVGTPTSVTLVDGTAYVLSGNDVFTLDFSSDTRVSFDDYPFEFDGEYITDSRIYLQAEGPIEVLGISYDVDDTDNPASA